MSRSSYTDDYDDQWTAIMWRGAVASAMRGKRGQAFLKEMLDAMDTMDTKRLIKNNLATAEDACAIGAVGKLRGIDMSGLDPDDSCAIAKTFGISNAMVCEIVYMNDEHGWNFRERREETPEERFQRMRQWIESEILYYQFHVMRHGIRRAHGVKK